MKYCKKALAAALVTLIFFSVFSPVSVTASTPERYGRGKLGQMSNGANFQFVYDKIVSGCARAEAEIPVDISGRNIDINSDLGLIYTMVYSDYPEYFWINGSWNCTLYRQGSTEILTVKPKYTMTGTALTSARAAYDAKVSQLTAGVSGSDYDKAKILHDRLVDTVTYTSTANDQNAYGALVEGKAVCNGYARAYQHLLMKVGIQSWYVNGTSNNPSTNTPVGHAWNLVKIDGQWYYTDVTWDDQGANTFYTYFNITTQQLLDGHAISAKYVEFVPNATATAANYYVKEGRIFDSYDQAKLVALLKKDNKRTQIYITGDKNAFVTALNENLKSLAADLGAAGSYSVSYNMSSLGKGRILDVVITQKGHTHAVKETVSQANPSCLSAGTKAYYVCDCGLKFLDQGCTQQVTSDSQLEIKAKEHTPSGWKNDAANHWKECTQCGTETANTRSAHTDENGDNKCDTCGYALPVQDTGATTPGTEPEETTPVTEPTEATQPPETTPATEPTDATQPTQPTEPVGSEPTQPTEGTQATQPAGSEPTEPGETTPATESADTTPDAEPTQPTMTDPTTPTEKRGETKDPEENDAPVNWPVIVGAGGAVLVVGAVAIVIGKKKTR